MDYTAVGQTTHLAARMEQLADPGAILLTPATLALAEGYVAGQLARPRAGEGAGRRRRGLRADGSGPGADPPAGRRPSRG